MTLKELKQCLEQIPPELENSEVRFQRKAESCGFYESELRCVSYGEAGDGLYVVIKAMEE